MKQILTKIKVLMLFFVVFGFAMSAKAQTYQMYFTNVTATANTIEWDAYLLRTGGTNLELATVQFGFGFDITIMNGGTLTASILAGTSELPTAMQPTSITVGTVNYAVAPVPAGQTHRYVNVAAKSPPGNGNGPSISAVTGGCTSPGTRIARFRLTNTANWTANSKMNQFFSQAVGSGRTKTQVNAYVGGLNTNITVNENNLSYNVAGTCDQNITLNPVATCAVTGSATTTAVSCFGSTDGSATVTLSGTGAGAPGTYTVDGGSAIAYSTNPFTVSGLAAGNHTVVATVTAGGCVSTDINFNIGSPAALNGTAVPTAVSCFGSTDGTATVTLSGGAGSAPGTYTVDGGSAVAFSANPFTITGMAAGNHTVVATLTAGGCVSTDINVNISSPAALTGSGSATPVSCFGSTDGTATITLSSSTSGTYTVDGGAPASYNSNPFTITGLAAGNHTIVATSTAGCASDLIGVNIGSPAALNGTAVGTAVTCFASSDGTATVTLSGGAGSAPGTYTVDGGSSVAFSSNPFTITGMAAGNHIIVATLTAGGCVSSDIGVNIGAPATFTATFAKTNITACNAGNDGTITITPAGGNAPYTYAWSGGYPGFAPGNVSSVSGLPIGYYNVMITDAGGCGVVTLTNIHISFAFTVYVTSSGSASSSCGNTGSVILYGNAGVLPYQYSIDGTNYVSTNTFTGLAAGTYTGYVKDAGGCVSTKPDIVVGAAAAITVSPFARGTSACANDGSIEIYRSGGISPYTYSIDGTTYQISNIFSGLASGAYTAYVKDSKGCIGTASVTVAQGAALNVTASKVNTSTCTNDGSIQVAVAGGVAPYTYSKDGTTFQTSNSFANLGAATYTITVKDFKGCLGTLNVTIALNPILVTAYATAASSCASSNGKIQLFRTGGYGPYTYSLDGNTYQTSTIFTNLAPGTYTGFVKDSKTCVGMLAGIEVGPSGCPPTFTKGNINSQVEVAAKTSIKVQAYPNPSASAFTLVLDGFNSMEKVSVTITDLMGKKVYQTEGIGKLQYQFGKNFISGMYNVQVVQGTEKKSLTLIKN